MKEQYLVTSDDRVVWTSTVNRLLNEGWLVVPGTLQLAVASTATNSGSPNWSSADKYGAFAVVLERETSKV